MATPVDQEVQMSGNSFQLAARPKRAREPNPFKRAAGVNQVRLAAERFRQGRTFTCFPKIPIELRLKIWRHSLPRQRVIEILNKSPGHTKGSKAIALNGFLQYYLKYPAILVMSINYESRQVAKEHYEELKLEYRRATASPRGFFNLQMVEAEAQLPIALQSDKLFLPSTDLSILSNRLDTSRLAHLAMIFPCPPKSWSVPAVTLFRRMINKTLAAAPKLETLELVIGQTSFSESFKQELLHVEIDSEFIHLINKTLRDICPPGSSTLIHPLIRSADILHAWFRWWAEHQRQAEKCWDHLNFKVCVLAGQKKDEEKFDGLWFMQLRCDGAVNGKFQIAAGLDGWMEIPIGYQNAFGDQKIILLGDNDEENKVVES